ncbi:ClpXP protease specificity-enhancing factor [Curvibacter sp. PAE-UM]|uniref:ClpXP protease specificity-enhancing factor n=1 Tax=Curvibacter sp. PAE-UM TaxID=1714344 RepID=UPI00070D38C5|nr:ClpXP protease specificity-enhancing factor [Curvibacter sp. PAE-UM]KRI01574.1 starvation protein B [Curvibacter sp. PAE-UM]
MTSASGTTSTRPYLIRALYEWCTDNGLTPYVAVRVDDTVRVPREYVKDGEIVLNISMDATSALKLGNDYIEFKARFAGVARDIMVPLNRVMAIYARESGQGMAFALDEDEQTPMTDEVGSVGLPVEPEPVASPATVLSSVVPVRDEGGDEPEPPRPGGTRPALKRVK